MTAVSDVTMNGAVRLFAVAGDPRAQGGLGALRVGPHEGGVPNRRTVDQTSVRQPADRQGVAPQERGVPTPGTTVYDQA